MKKTLLLAAATFISLKSSAQLSISPELGFQMYKLNEKIAGTKIDFKFKPGFKIGANATYAINDKLSIDGALFYSVKGAKFDESIAKATTNLNYLEIPFFVNYHFGAKDKNHFFVGAGPYLAYCLSGKTKQDSESTKLEIGSDAEKDDVKPMDFGLNANVGYEMSNGLYLRAFYSLGLANTTPGGDGDNATKNMGFGLSAGYRLKF
ncbi:MAG: porin family protein [Phycisphaerales bacterium]|nr:porin family protein [Phycisphaerales bacterium]